MINLKLWLHYSIFFRIKYVMSDSSNQLREVTPTGTPRTLSGSTWRPRTQSPANRAEAERLADQYPEAVPGINELAKKSMLSYAWKKKSKALIQFSDSLDKLDYKELLNIKREITKKDILLLQDESICDLINILSTENHELKKNIDTLGNNVTKLLQLGLEILKNRGLLLKRLGGETKFKKWVTTTDLNSAYGKVQQDILTTLYKLREDYAELTDTIETLEELYITPQEAQEEE